MSHHRLTNQKDLGGFICNLGVFVSEQWAGQPSSSDPGTKWRPQHKMPTPFAGRNLASFFTTRAGQDTVFVHSQAEQIRKSIQAPASDCVIIGFHCSPDSKHQLHMRKKARPWYKHSTELVLILILVAFYAVIKVFGLTRGYFHSRCFFFRFYKKSSAVGKGSAPFRCSTNNIIWLSEPALTPRCDW